MKLSLLALIPAAVAFLDTAPLLINKDIGTVEHFVESADVKAKIYAVMDQACQQDIPVHIYRAQPGAADEPSLAAHSKRNGLTVFPNVKYESRSDVEFDIPQSCKDKADLISHVDFSQSAEISTDGVSIVQMVPKFGASFGEQVMDFVEQKFHHKKHNELNIEAEHHLEGEIVQEMEDAEHFVAEQGDEDFLDSLEGEESDIVSALRKSTNKSLFNNYSFFTPGLLSCLIVSFLLIGILVSAMSWITSLEITYKAFDKQIDYEKKTE